MTIIENPVAVDPVTKIKGNLFNSFSEIGVFYRTIQGVSL